MVLENFALGLKVTGLGMGLVFLTLVVVMVAIYLLDRIFRVKPADIVALGVDDAGATDVSLATSADEAAAVALAITLKKAQEEEGVYEGEIPAEAVMVASIEPGSDAWRSHGRLRAMQ